MPESGPSMLARNLDNRVSLVEHELNGIKSSQNEINSKLDNLATAVTSLISRPVHSIAHLLQMALHTMLIVGSLGACITFVSGSFHADKFSSMRDEIQANETRIKLLELKIKHGIKE